MMNQALALALGGAIALASPLVVAQRVLEEVIVTAQKREQSIQDVPLSITAFSGDELEKRGATAFTDLATISPGLVLESVGIGGTQIRMRGVGNAQSIVVPLKTGVFLDGVTISPIDSVFTNLLDVQRVEILKGPQGTLWGRNVTAGAISITTKPVAEELAGMAEVIADEDGGAEYRGYIDIPVVDDKLGIRLGAYYTEVAGWVEDITNGHDLYEERRNGAKLKAHYRATDNLSIELSGEYGEFDHNPGFDIFRYGSTEMLIAQLVGVDLIPADPSDGRVAGKPGQPNIYGHARYKRAILKVQLDDLPGNHTLTSLSSYQDFDTDQLVAVAEQFELITSDSIDTNESISQELRLTSNNDGAVDYLAGLYYQRDKRTQDTALIFEDAAIALFALQGLPLNVGDAGIVDSFFEFTSLAAFGNMNIDLSDRLTLTLGARYNNEKVEQLNSLVGEGNAVFIFGAAPPVDVSDTFERVTGDVKLAWSLTDDVTLYAQYARGFIQGGFNTGLNPLTQEPDPYKEEVSDNYEIGIKSFWWNKRVLLNATLYRQEFSDYHVQSPSAETATNLTRNADVESEGVELDFRVLLTENLSVDGNIAYINARYENFPDSNCASNIVVLPDDTILNDPGCFLVARTPVGNVVNKDLSGERLHDTSPWSANLNIEYTQPWEAVSGHWYVRAEAVFRDDYIAIPEHDRESFMPSYTFYNARFGVQIGETWEVALWGKNLNDEEYFNYDVRRAAFLPDSLVGMPARPRTFGVTVRAVF